MEHREVTKLLMSDGALYRLQGIFECLDNHIVDEDIIDAFPG